MAYQISYNHFSEININRFVKFEFYDIDKLSDFQLYCDRGMVVRFQDKYYAYKGLKDFTSSEKQPSFILVTKGRRTLYKITDKVNVPDPLDNYNGEDGAAVVKVSDDSERFYKG